MTLEKEYEIVDEISKLLLDITMLTKCPEIPSRYDSIDSLQVLNTKIIFLRNFLYSAANGDFSMRITDKGFLAGTLKTLQANLRHLTWQTKMIASGDFSQRVEFMGDFSESFNTMVIQLEKTLNDLVDKESELSTSNEELLKEIVIRKKTEKKLRKSEKALKLQAITDPLTKLFNRRYFFKLAEKELKRACRYSRSLSIIMYDIDFFKKINDTFGHPSGDMVLKSIADITKKEIRATDIPARYGGEEFITLLPETSIQGAAIIAERIRKQIEITIVQNANQEISATASFGVSDFFRKPEKGSPKIYENILTEFISSADEALYESKNKGRNRVTTFTAE